MGRVNLKTKDFLEGEATGVVLRGYPRRRELQGVGRVMERSKRKRTPCASGSLLRLPEEGCWGFRTVQG